MDEVDCRVRLSGAHPLPRVSRIHCWTARTTQMMIVARARPPESFVEEEVTSARHTYKEIHLQVLRDPS